MTTSASANLLRYFPFEPTKDQEKLIQRMSDFLSDSTERKTFLLKGYAGTGKTSFIKSLVRSLPSAGYKFVLLAPTGRAAKVMTDYSGFAANTIHRTIYNIKPSAESSLYVRLAKNECENTIFIVDEASMISSGDDRNLLRGRNLLNDLFSFIFNQRGCSVIFIGDTAQLPPVGETKSVALDEEYIQNNFRTKIYSTELKEVVRQKKDSGILMNATSLRMLIAKSAKEPILRSEGFADVQQLDGENITDNLESYFSSRSAEDSLVVCRSNKQANKYNQYIRTRILGYEDVISSGDRIMIVKNNYFWLGEESKTGFIANGDVIRIKRVYGFEEKFGFNFADVEVEMPDYPSQPAFKTKLLIDTISSEAPALSQEENKKLFEKIHSGFGENVKSSERLRQTYADEYYNALQVKFSYAVTCHKAQGGQWPNVFVDAGFVTAQNNNDYLRWLYTAVTRAKEKLFFVNFDKQYFR